MADKDKQVHVRVSGDELVWLRGKAASYGVTVSSLLLLAARAYERAYDEVPWEGGLVAVNYGAWVRLTSRLGSVDRNLRMASLRLSRVARALGGDRRGDAGRVATAVEACLEDVRAMRGDVARCTAAAVAVAAREQLVDPALAQDPQIAGAAEGGGA